jgi:Domain of unknown function (DUF222)
LAAELRLSRAAAGVRLALAAALAERLPDTAAALAAGEIDLPRARAVADATGELDPAAALAVEARVLPRAAARTASQPRAGLRRAVLAVDPSGAEARHERAVAERRVAVSALPDGMAELYALLPAPAASAVYTALDRHARRPGRPADVPMDARRADALVELVTHRGTAASVPVAEGASGGLGALAPLVQVTVAATTLLGMDGQPAELAGHGPIPAQVARQIAADPSGTWRRILSDPATAPCSTSVTGLPATPTTGPVRHRPGRDVPVPGVSAAGERHVGLGHARTRSCRWPHDAGRVTMPG